MKLTSKISIFTIVIVIIFAVLGCLNETDNPVDTGKPPNDNDSNDTGAPIDYGTLYFKSDAETIWITSGPVTVDQGDITAQNDGSANRIGSCVLYEGIYFGNDRNISVTWKEEISGGSSYRFWISDSLDPHQQLSFSEDTDGNMVAQFSMYMISKVHLYYQFDVPENSSVIISDIHAYAK
ncbi:hypothetical protein K9N50_06270 [bacterium]|nr:hypothetical protein [bacterium]